MNNLKQKIFSLLFVAGMTLLTAAQAAGTPTDTFNLATATWSSGTDASNLCTWNGTVLTVNNGADIAVTGAVTDGSRRIEIAANATATITLDNVTIDCSATSATPMWLHEGADVTLTLTGTNTLTGGTYFPGLQVHPDATLAVGGDGTLNATGGGNGAGIGAGPGDFILTFTGVAAGTNVTISFTDGSSRVGTVDASGAVLARFSDSSKTVASITLGSGSPVLIGRKVDGNTISLSFNSSGNLQFRPAVGGQIPIGSYAEFQMINVLLSGNYKQEANLDFAGLPNWTPVGSNFNNPFTGQYDGGGHSISNLHINQPTAYFMALFGVVSGNISDVHIASGSVTGSYYVAGICGYNNGRTIASCSNAATITGTVANSSGYGTVGGIAGENDGTVIDCGNTGAISGTGGLVGGVVGIGGTITACRNTGTVSGTTNYVGGVVGNNGSSRVTACYNTGAVTGTGVNSTDIGGITGGTASTVTACYNTGAVSGNYNVGGVVGLCTITGAAVTSCYWNITASGQTNAVGAVTNGATATNNFSFTSSDTDIFVNDITSTHTTYPGWAIDTSGTGASAYWKDYTGGGLPKLWWEGTVTGGNNTGSSSGTLAAGGSIAISGGTVTAQGAVAINCTITALPNRYVYWTDTTDADPGGSGTVVEPGAAGFVNDINHYKYVKIQALGMPTVSGVAVSPSSVSVQKGQTQTFTALVSGENYPPQTVTWTVEGGGAGTSITTNGGVLIVALNETATTLTVRATSTVDPSVFDTAAVTVTEIPKETTPTAGIDFINETLTGLSGSYTINGNAVTVTGDYPIDAAWFNTTIVIIKKGNDTTTLDSDPQNLPIPARPAQPSGVAGVNVSAAGANDGKITGVTTSMEYSTDSTSWTTCPDVEVTNLAAGTYYVRIKAANSAFHSEAITVIIETSTGIKQLTMDNEQLTIYPNPTSGKLIIAPLSPPKGGKQAPSNSPSGGEQPTIEIFDVVGQVVFMSQLSKLSPETTIDISHLANGLYFLKVNGKMVKIVKK